MAVYCQRFCLVFGSMIITMCGVKLKGTKRAMDLLHMLGLIEAIDKLGMANSVHGYVLRREGCHVFRMAFEFDIEGQRKKGRS